MKNLKFQKGQSLFELVVAIAISALIITAIVAVTANSINNSSYSRDKTLASAHVQEAMEWLRHERDINSEFKTKAIPGVIYCLYSFTLSTPTTCPDSQKIGEKFTRELTFLDCPSCQDNVVEVKVSVTWFDSKGLHEVSSSTDLSLE